MSIETRTAFPTKEAAMYAAEQLVLGVAVHCSYLISPVAGAQILEMPTDQFEVIVRAEDRRSIRPTLDPDRFEIIGLIGRMADFAWRGEWFSNESGLSEAITELNVLDQWLEQPAFDPYGEPIVDDSSRGLLRLTRDAATGRWLLGEDGGALGLDQLAALAGVSDKTIRMAANPKKPGHIKTAKVGTRTVVDAEDALEWLTRRPSFHPTRMNVELDGQVHVADAATLAMVCSRFRERSGMNISTLRKALHWSASDTLSYQNMERGHFEHDSPTFNAAQMIQLAEALQLPHKEQFVRDAIRVVVNSRAKAQILRLMGDHK